MAEDAIVLPAHLGKILVEQIGILPNDGPELWSCTAALRSGAQLALVVEQRLCPIRRSFLFVGCSAEHAHKGRSQGQRNRLDPAQFPCAENLVVGRAGEPKTLDQSLSSRVPGRRWTRVRAAGVG